MAGTNTTLSLRYAQIYERELAGDRMTVVRDYRELFPMARASDRELAEKILFRIGLCERRSGQPEQARRAWRELKETFPLSDAAVSAAHELLKELEWEMDRVAISGKVAGGRESIVFAGEWGNEPPVLTGPDGGFRVERRATGQLPDGHRYGLIYAEHPSLPLVGADAWTGGKPSGLTIQLALPVTLSGRVVDLSGRPVANARIHVTGFKAPEASKRDIPPVPVTDFTAVTLPTYTIPLPLDRIIPPVFSAANGDFTIEGLPSGLRYMLIAEKSGYRLVSGAESGTILLQFLGEISLRGRVMDEKGMPVSAELTVHSMPPVIREVGRVLTDAQGWFVIRDLLENLISIDVESKGYLSRSVSGLKPMGQEIDVVLRRESDLRSQTSDFKELKSEIRDQELEVGSGEGAGSAIVMPDSLTTQQISNCFTAIHWLGGSPESGAPLRFDELKGHVVVYHFDSAYVEASSRSQYPGESGGLSKLMKLYGDQGLICLWVLPEGEGKGESVPLALGLYPDLSVGQGGEWPVKSGNVVVGRDGKVRAICSDQQLFKAVKKAVLSL